MSDRSVMLGVLLKVFLFLSTDYSSSQSISLYLWVATGSFLVTFVMFYIISPAVSSRHFSAYKGLTIKKRVDWDTRYV